MQYLLMIQTLIAAIHAVQSLMPASKGAAKFDAAVAVVEGVVGDVTNVLPALSAIATATVNGLRAIGHPDFVKAV